MKFKLFYFLLVWVGQLMVQQIRQLVEDSEIMKEDDEKWPKKNVVGRQELEIRLGNEHISFEVSQFMPLNLRWTFLMPTIFKYL